MAEAIALILLVSLIGAVLVPGLVLTLAAIGAFEPIVVSVRGRVWRFGAKDQDPQLSPTASTSVATEESIGTSSSSVTYNVHVSAVGSVDGDSFPLLTSGEANSQVVLYEEKQAA